MHTIHVRAFPPYRAWLDGQSDLLLEVEGPIEVREMWARLARPYPRFSELVAYETDEELSRALIVLQDGRLLGPADLIKPGAPVELLPSIAGGRSGPERKVRNPER